MNPANGNGPAPSPPALRVLLIEDSAADTGLLCRALQQADARTRIYEERSFMTGLDRLVGGENFDLVMLDLAVRDNEGLDGLRAIRTYAPNVTIIALLATDHDGTVMKALQMGAEECLVKSKIDPERLGRVLHRLSTRPPATGQSQASATVKRAAVVGLLGSKGGVGTTTVACHLALELHQQSAGRVLLLDLDLTANSIGFLMKVQSKHAILAAANSIVHLDEARWNDMTTRTPEGLEILPSGGPAYREDQLPRIERLRCLLHFIRSIYDWIVIDFGRLAPLTAGLSGELTQVFVVSSLGPAALNGTIGVARGLKEAGVPDVRLLVNRAPKAFDMTPAEMQNLVNLPVEAMLPECEQQFKETISAKQLLGQSRLFSAQIAPLARRLAGGVEEVAAKKLFGLFRLRA